MNIFALCTTAAGLDVLDVAAVPLAGLIGLTPRNPGDLISGFIDIEPFARTRGIPFVAVDSYGLNLPADRSLLETLAIDILIVVGWQRLIPAWLISRAKIGVLGLHGSASGITAGRGRSPQNWAIMLGAKRFSVSLFLITPGIDDGPVIATADYDLSASDDIADSYRKLAIVAGAMIANTIRDDPMLTRHQPQTGATFYLPQRQPEDGAVDWSRSADEVLAFIRALARPYPGAFCDLGDGHIRFWRAAAYKLDTLSSAAPGTITGRFRDNSFLVACRQHHVLVQDWEVVGDATISQGMVLPSIPFRDHIGRIVARHSEKYPELPLAPSIIALLAD